MSFLTLQEAADQLGVHYMTAYRYVRTGRLDASKEGPLWQVHVDDLQAFVEGKDPSDVTASLTSFDDAWLRLYKRLVAGDEAGSWNIVEECLTSGMTPHNIYDRLVAPAMVEVGDRWAAGKLDVGSEHLATAIATRLIGRLGPQFNRPGRSRGSIVVAMVAGDTHALPTSMLADVLRLHRFDVVDLGANTPVDSIVKAVSSNSSLVAVGLCSASGEDPHAVKEAVEALHAAGFGDRLFVGGAAVDAEAISRLSPAPRVTKTSQDVLDFVDMIADTTSAVAS